MSKSDKMYKLNKIDLEKPGDHLVNVPTLCVITRFGLRSPRYLLPTYLDYLKVMKQTQLERNSGLLRSAFLIENPSTCYSLSIWSSWEEIPQFGNNVPQHINTARQVFNRVQYKNGRGPEIWSTKWKLVSVSNNLNWDNFDLREVIIGVSGESNG